MLARCLSAVTILLCIPLFLTYPIKHTLFRPGYLFVTLYSAGLLSVLMVPVLLVVELVFLMLSFRQGGRVGDKRWHFVGVVTALSAEVVFLIGRQL